MRILVAAVMVVASAGEARVEFDAQRLQTGHFRYRTLLNDRVVGETVIGIRKADGRFVFSNAVGGAFAQSWEAITRVDFTPVSAKLVFGEGASAKAAFELVYGEGRVTGFAKEKKVDEAVAGDTVDQRVDWAAVMSLPDYQDGGEYRFHVYDPGTGNSRVAVKVGVTETVKVPAGVFTATRLVYSIAKKKGTEKYLLLVREGWPRLMLLEQFPNGAVTELVEAKP